MNELALRKARILILDNEVSALCLLKNVLNRLGFANVMTIADPREVFDEFTRFRPDIVLLDLSMPHLTGFEVLERLRRLIPAESYLPILVLSGELTAQNRRRALQGGATDVLAKPFDSSEALMRIRNLLWTRFLHLELQDQNHRLEDKVVERTRALEQALDELQQTQRQIVQQERLRAFGEMASGVVHDFNNALMSVVGYSELLLNDPATIDDKDTVLDYLRIMNTAGHDAAEVISRLRDFYRPRSDGDVFTALDLNKLIEAIVPLTQPKWKDQALADGRHIEVRFDLEKLPRVTGNAGELREVLTNLIFNAVDAMPFGGSITLRSRRDPAAGGVLVEIADTGTGMTEEVRTRCLEPFFSTKGDHGTGLGLSMVFGIVQRHEGQLEIESVPGEGTTFRIRLPIAAGRPQPANGNGTDPSAKPARALRILLVDDDAVPRDVCAKYLLADGHEVVTAVNGIQATEVFGESQFDLVVTDQAMPGMNGVQLAHVLRERRPGQPIILITGFSDPTLDETTPPEGIDLILQKPPSQDALRQAVAKVCTA